MKNTPTWFAQLDMQLEELDPACGACACLYYCGGEAFARAPIGHECGKIEENITIEYVQTTSN